MEVYLVGGAVRDKIMGSKPHDKDYVVTGSTIQEMIDNGYKQVGNDFPVFLHPETGDEYALARTEKKVGDKHTDFIFGFDKQVSLLDDLYRRDFTCNAIAYNAKNEDCWLNCLIDPFRGQADIADKVLRAVNPKTFVEDPLRVVRAARFSAQLGFTVEPNTMELLKKMVNEGMLEHLTPERVWKETEKALTEGYDSNCFFEVLNECGALKVLFPELYQLTLTPERVEYHPSGNSFKHTMIALSRVKVYSSQTKFMVLCHDFGKGVTPQDILPKHIGHEYRGLPLIEDFCNRLKVPNEYKKLAKIFCENHMKFYRMLDMRLSKKYNLVKSISEKCHNETMLERMVQSFYADFHGENVEVNALNEFNFNKIVEDIWHIFFTMRNVNLDCFSEACRQRLVRLEGEKFGKAYNDAMLNYLENHY